MNDSSAKQQIVEKIRDANNILVTVSRNPSVDELAAALGLTMLLNKMNKHATAVFSGVIPPAITFLDPKKTFENTVDSLRDFIIALNKEKADHLRYKVEGDVVKIFITPYRTTIGDKDLEFSQGDYNVELVLALGVKDQGNLDTALEAHGRIFHDATVATLSVGDDKSTLGGIDWNEHSASSLSEMLVSLSDTLEADKKLLDETIATAFLTGIVASTDRFSNRLTSSRVMTVAAQLMAAGANQQLIATKLQEASVITDTSSEKTDANKDGTVDLDENKPTKLKKNDAAQKPDKKSDQDQPPAKKKDAAGELSISHEKEGTLDEVGQQTASEQQAQAATEAEEALAKQARDQSPVDEPITSDDDLAKQLAAVSPAQANTPSVADLQHDIAAANAEVEEAAAAPATMTLPAPVTSSDPEMPPYEPSLGGTLSATAEEASEDKRREEASDRNHTILSHESGSYVGNDTPTYNAPLNSSVDAATQAEQKPLADPMAEPNFMSPSPSSTFASPALQPIALTLADIDSANRSPHEAARSDIDAAFAASSQMPQSTPAMPPMPDFSTLPPLPPLPSDQASQSFSQPQSSPASDGHTNPFVDPATIPTPPTAREQPEVGPSDPGQFQIPGAK